MPPLDQYDGQMDIITWKCPNLWTSQAQDCSAPESGCHCEPPAAGPGPGGGGQPMLCSRSRGPGTQNCSQALRLKFRAGSLLQQRQRGCSENLTSCLVQLLYWMQGFGVELSHRTETVFFSSKNLFGCIKYLGFGCLRPLSRHRIHSIFT